jgi:hypothetical protein
MSAGDEVRRRIGHVEADSGNEDAVSPLSLQRVNIRENRVVTRGYYVSARGYARLHPGAMHRST